MEIGKQYKSVFTVQRWVLILTNISLIILRTEFGAIAIIQMNLKVIFQIEPVLLSTKKLDNIIG